MVIISINLLIISALCRLFIVVEHVIQVNSPQIAFIHLCLRGKCI